jgi:hypothetical protein
MLEYSCERRLIILTYLIHTQQDAFTYYKVNDGSYNYTSHMPENRRRDIKGRVNCLLQISEYCLHEWYSAFFIRVPPHGISLQLVP